MPDSLPLNLAELENKIQDIFPMPQILEKILQAVNDPDASAGSIEAVFKFEPSLTLKLLTMANSAYFGSPGRIRNIRAAITLLGLNMVKSLAIHASVNELFRFGSNIPAFSGPELWKHSVGVAVALKLLSRRLNLGNGEDYFTLGIVHDLGLIILYQFYRQPFIAIYTRSQTENVPVIQIEREILGVDHAQVARILCEKWRMPDTFTRLIPYHHQPLEAPADIRKEVFALYAADTLVRQVAFGFGFPAEPIGDPIWAGLGLKSSDRDGLIAEFNQHILDMTIFLQ
jgi:HD-like signal output (HDOD) protein